MQITHEGLPFPITGEAATPAIFPYLVLPIFIKFFPPFYLPEKSQRIPHRIRKQTNKHCNSPKKSRFVATFFSRFDKVSLHLNIPKKSAEFQVHRDTY